MGIYIKIFKNCIIKIFYDDMKGDKTGKDYEDKEIR